MKIKEGQLVKLKDYTGFSDRMGEYAFVKYEYSDTSVEEYGNELNMTLAWLKDHKVFATILGNVKKITTNKLVNVLGEKELEIGDVVITNADGSSKSIHWIEGVVGEKVSQTGTRGNIIYLWTNATEGDRGKLSIMGNYKYSYRIYDKNQTANLKVIGKIEISTKGKCKDCGDDINFVDAKKNDLGDYICKECYDGKYMECSNCEKVVRSDDYCTSDDGDCFCQECYDDKFTQCNSCDEEIRRENSLTGSDENLYCENCYNDRFAMCSACERTYDNEDLIYNEEHDEYLCPNCERKNKSKIIHDYGYKPEAIFSELKWEKSVYMGVELEVQEKDGETTDSSNEFDKFLKDCGTQKYFYLKHDSSVEGGFEIVSHPFTLQYAHKNIGFKKILDWLIKNNFESEESGACGLHVHVGRNFFEDLDITKLRLFFRNNTERLRVLSKREGHEHFSEFETTNVKSILNDSANLDGRYWALNLNSSRETVEFRLFRGTLNAQRFIAILQFVDAICNFVKDVGITSLIIGEKDYKFNSWKLFIDWCKDENKYNTMLAYFAEERICA